MMRKDSLLSREFASNLAGGGRMGSGDKFATSGFASYLLTINPSCVQVRHRLLEVHSIQEK